MLIQSSANVPFTTNPARYLFRVLWTPTVFQNYEQFAHYAPVDVHGDDYRENVYKITTNDYLLTLPPTSENIIDAANRIAYAESLLYVNRKLINVTVWLVEEVKGIDRKTPCMVLHPYNSHELKLPVSDMIEFRGANPIPEPVVPTMAGHLPTDFADTPRGFQSFDLVTGDPETYITDPFLALDVTRDCETGRVRHQFYEGVLGADDYYFIGNRLVLNTEGSLCKLRFPWYEATLELLQYTHNGWKINEDGSINHSRIALGERIANGAVNCAQARRQQLIKGATTSWVERMWFHTVYAVMNQLNRMDVWGWSEEHDWPTAENPAVIVKYAVSPTSYLLEICRLVTDFINFAGVAQGDTALAFAFPFDTEASRHAIWTRYSNFIHNPFTGGGTIAQHENTINDTIVLAMIDILGNIIGALTQLAVDEDSFLWHFLFPLGMIPVIPLTNDKNAHNAFSVRYAEMQGEAQALLSLLMTWQYTFKPYQPTRTGSRTRAFSTVDIPRPSERERRAIIAEQTTAVPIAHIEGRVLEMVPLMAPWRTWDVDIPTDTSDDLYLGIVAQNERNARLAAQAAIDAAHAAKRAERKAALQLLIDQRTAELQASSPDPVDVWDYRNNTNLKWWTTPVPVQDVPRFIGHALDTPDEIQTLQDVFGMPKKVAAGIKRLEPLIIGVRDIIHPHMLIRDIVKSPEFKLLLKKVGQIAFEEVKSQIQSNAMSRVAQGVAPPNPQYSPRQIWPIDAP